MNLKQALKLADERVFEKTGQHLNDLQEAILQGTLQRDTYKEIAKNFDCSESSVRKVGAELWEILSEELGEEVSKTNFRSAMQRFQVSIYSNVAKEESVQINSINLCKKARNSPNILNSHPSNQETSNSKTTKISHQDLSEMPDLGNFYSRTPQLDTLTNWILQQRCRLIAITGISGIGKTALASQLVRQIKDEFEYVIWCNLDASYTPDELQHTLIQFFSQPQNPNPPPPKQKPLPLIKYLQNYRCLIILDDIHNLFISGELAGKYRSEHEEYRSLFKQIENFSHQSCLLSIGWEQPREVSSIEIPNTPIRILQLSGLDTAAAREILRDKGLPEIDCTEALIHRYQGNPLCLKSVVTLIQELGIDANELLLNDTVLLPEDLKDVLQQQFSRLSEIEKQVLSLFCRESEPVNLAKLLECGTVRSPDLLNALQSLSRRCLIEKTGNLYSLPPVLRQYIKGL
jgi:NB-ARC domain